MKATELIEKLQKILAENGDVEVITGKCSGYGYFTYGEPAPIFDIPHGDSEYKIIL